MATVNYNDMIRRVEQYWNEMGWSKEKFKKMKSHQIVAIYMQYQKKGWPHKKVEVAPIDGQMSLLN